MLPGFTLYFRTLSGDYPPNALHFSYICGFHLMLKTILFAVRNSHLKKAEAIECILECIRIYIRIEYVL